MHCTLFKTDAIVKNEKLISRVNTYFIFRIGRDVKECIEYTLDSNLLNTDSLPIQNFKGRWMFLSVERRKIVTY